MQIDDLPPLPYKVPDEVLQKASNIKIALFDVDGVLTDGSLHYTRSGEQVKTFNALDGHGLKMLAASGIQVAIISARYSAALQRRLDDLGIKHQYLGVENKVQAFDQLRAELGVEAEQCCFTGDDVIDLAVMLNCGLKLSVSNGHYIVQHHADWVTPLAGGAGAVRAICDVLLYASGSYPIGRSSQQ